MTFYLRTATTKSPVGIFSYAMLSTRPGTCMHCCCQSPESPGHETVQYLVIFFLDLSDSMKDMVKYGLDQSEATWNQVSGYVCIGQRMGQSV